MAENLSELLYFVVLKIPYEISFHSRIENSDISLLQELVLFSLLLRNAPLYRHTSISNFFISDKLRRNCNNMN